MSLRDKSGGGGPQLSKNDSPRNLLPNRAIESFWDALWLELWPFLYFD